MTVRQSFPVRAAAGPLRCLGRAASRPPRHAETCRGCMLHACLDNHSTRRRFQIVGVVRGHDFRQPLFAGARKYQVVGHTVRSASEFVVFSLHVRSCFPCQGGLVDTLAAQMQDACVQPHVSSASLRKLAHLAASLKCPHFWFARTRDFAHLIKEFFGHHCAASAAALRRCGQHRCGQRRCGQCRAAQTSAAIAPAIRCDLPMNFQCSACACVLAFRVG